MYINDIYIFVVLRDRPVHKPLENVYQLNKTPVLVEGLMRSGEGGGF